jgi:hypothetical protein
VNARSEVLVVEQALVTYRRMKEATNAAPDGTVFDTAQSFAVAKEQALMRRSLEIVLHDWAKEVEKKELPAEPAHAATRDVTEVRNRAWLSRRRGR